MHINIPSFSFKLTKKKNGKRKSIEATPPIIKNNESTPNFQFIKVKYTFTLTNYNQFTRHSVCETV